VRAGRTSAQARDQATPGRDDEAGGLTDASCAGSVSGDWRWSERRIGFRCFKL